MHYVAAFLVVFGVIGLRAFQQKVVAANQYPIMGIIGTLIYVGEGTAVIMIAKGGMWIVVCGALGAGVGVMTAVYTYNRYFTKLFMKKGVTG
jgi:energy-converting hydrogenase Eha subunit A